MGIIDIIDLNDAIHEIYDIVSTRGSDDEETRDRAKRLLTDALAPSTPELADAAAAYTSAAQAASAAMDSPDRIVAQEALGAVIRTLPPLVEHARRGALGPRAGR